jgi:hypothetical protein
MKSFIIVTDDHGNSFEGEVELHQTAKRALKHSNPRSRTKQVGTSVDFATPIRAFIKRFGRGIGGPQRFVLLVAYLTKGQARTEVAVSDIEAQWNKMKSLLDGAFNRAHGTRAKDHGWVDSPKRGVYVLLPGWKAIFNA